MRRAQLRRDGTDEIVDRLDVGSTRLLEPTDVLLGRAGVRGLEQSASAWARLVGPVTQHVGEDQFLVRWLGSLDDGDVTSVSKQLLDLALPGIADAAQHG